jgi:NTP pyrophosphatase (non-canonical NTP hydrolase)
MSAAQDKSFQKIIEEIYFERDESRGKKGTLLWFVEEVGELVRAIRRGERQNLEEEFADVYAWLATLASLHGLDLEATGRKKYAHGCPRCRTAPCVCPEPKAVS